MPLVGHHSFKLIPACAHLFVTLTYSINKISSIFDGNTWSKNSQKYKTFFYIFWKVWTTNTPSFELMSKWNIHQHPPRERLHSGRETWLSVMEKASALNKCSHNPKVQKELAKLKTWKGGLGKNERPGGLKTRKGGPGKN